MTPDDGPSRNLRVSRDLLAEARSTVEGNSLDEIEWDDRMLVEVGLRHLVARGRGKLVTRDQALHVARETFYANFKAEMQAALTSVLRVPVTVKVVQDPSNPDGYVTEIQVEGREPQEFPGEAPFERALSVPQSL